MSLTDEMSAKLVEFSHLVREKTEEVNRASAKESEKLQTALAQFIGQQMQTLMAQGISVAAVQDTLRAAMEDMVPQTHAPDADSGEVPESSVEMTGYIDEISCCAPVAETVIADFAAGKLNGNELMAHICASPDIITFANTEEVICILNNYGKDIAYDYDCVTEGGEIVAGADGEAFMPEHLQFTEPGGYQFALCEPMVFKSPQEVAEIDSLLTPMSEKEFLKRVNVKKLLRTVYGKDYSTLAEKEDRALVGDRLWREFTQWQKVYHQAAVAQKGMALFVKYIDYDITDDSME